MLDPTTMQDSRVASLYQYAVRVENAMFDNAQSRVREREREGEGGREGGEGG